MTITDEQLDQWEAESPIYMLAELAERAFVQIGKADGKWYVTLPLRVVNPSRSYGLWTTEACDSWDEAVTAAYEALQEGTP